MSEHNTKPKQSIGLRDVGEVTYKKLHMAADFEPDEHVFPDYKVQELITQDRDHAYTLLKEGVEMLMQDEYPTEDGVPVETYGYEATHNQALKQVLTLLNQVFNKTN